VLLLRSIELGLLHEDGNAREEGVVSAMIEVEMRVDDRCDVAERGTRFC
jgi:hypothetical protein